MQQDDFLLALAVLVKKNLKKTLQASLKNDLDNMVREIAVSLASSSKDKIERDISEEFSGVIQTLSEAISAIPSDEELGLRLETIFNESGLDKQIQELIESTFQQMQTERISDLERDLEEVNRILYGEESIHE